MNDIPDSHMAFARALVALAREHSMNDLEVKFDHSGGRNWKDPQSPYRTCKTTFIWEEGRHGARTRIFMSRSEDLRFDETEPASPSLPSES